VSLFRYIAWIWHRESNSQSQCAQDLSSRLLASKRHQWNVAVSREELCVFHTGGHPGAVACHPLPDEAGVVLGTVFLRGAASGSGETSRSRAFTCNTVQGKAILSSGGRWLVEMCWGRYVALFGDSGGSTFRVLRDPSGTMPCLVAAFEGLTVVFSHPEDAMSLGVLKPSIDWRYIATHVSQPQLNSHRTALNEISAICAGECFSWNDGQTSGTFLWHPASFARNGPGFEEPDRCVEEVYSTIRHCVHSWASRHDSVLLRLSGGVDSSTVLTCLQSAPHRGSLTAVNCFSRDSLGDERVYARAAAQHAHCPLVELGIEPELDLRSILTVGRSARPGHYFTGLQTGPHESRLAQELQATAIFGGGWGDQLFYRIRNDCAATDYIATHGWLSDWLTVARDAAQLSRTTVWSVLAGLLRNRLLRRPWTPFPTDPRQDTYIRPDSYAGSDPEAFLHPWLQEAKGLPPGKLWHIFLLSAPADFQRPVARDDDPEPIEPLRSQPLMELCLGIPTYVLTCGGGDRLLVRTAFERDLPSIVTRRLSKGFVDEGFQSMVRHNAPFVRELMLDGLLVKQNILDRPKLERALSDGFLRGGPPQSELFSHICTEAWLRVWQAA
jgi:asparagine synthase (glutamine-hydrolysing)